MTVSVTFNVTDLITGSHLHSINFIPANGDAALLVDSPFIHSYGAGTFYPVVEIAGYKGSVMQLIVATDPVVKNVTLGELLDVSHSSFANTYIDQPIYSANNVLTSCRVRIYGDAVNVGTDVGVIATYNMLATELAGTVLTYMTAKL